VDFITIVSSDYDSALRQARLEHGSAVRIQTRRDFAVGSSLSKKSACEISFYLVQQGQKEIFCAEPVKEEIAPVEVVEAPAEIPVAPVETKKVSEGFLSQMVAPSQSKAFLVDLLKDNDFGEEYIAEAAQAILAGDPLFAKDDFEMQILDYIIDSIEIDHSSYTHPPKYFVLLGPTGVGKTTTMVKVAMLYSQIVPCECQLKVAILSLDSFRAGAHAQIETFCQDLDLDLFSCNEETELSTLLEKLNTYDLVLVDTMGKSPKDGELAVKLKTMLSVLPKDDTGYYLAVSASHKQRDMDRYLQLLSSYRLSSIVVTKTDETENIGNILSFSKKHRIPLLFLTDGQKVPQDLHKASNELILGFLQGFSLDFSTLGTPQSISLH
jgi:flagellar biosynthesis protein FlhF